MSKYADNHRIVHYNLTINRPQPQQNIFFHQGLLPLSSSHPDFSFMDTGLGLIGCWFGCIEVGI